MTDQQIDAFSKYVTVCNEVLQANKDRFPYNYIINALSSQKRVKNVEVEVIEATGTGKYCLQFDGNKLEARGECTGCSVGCAFWCIKRQYVDSVIESPQTYIANPARIDWEWLCGNN